MKFDLIFDNDELIIITENGGIVCTRKAECTLLNRIAVTDYYAEFINEIEFKNLNELLSQLMDGNLRCKDWVNDEYNSLKVIENALCWLCPNAKSWEYSADLYLKFFKETFKIN